jgi:hypothetical protein
VFGHRRRRFISMLLAGTLAVPLAAACQSTPASSPTSTSRRISSSVSREFAVGAAPELVVEDQVGAITVEVGEAGKVSVEAIKRANDQTTLDRIVVGFEQSGEQVRLEFKLPQGMGAVASGNPEVEFKVKAPANTKLDLMTEVGSIFLTGLSGGAVAEATVGAITSRNVKGTQELTSVTGAISVSGAAGTVRATVDTGAVDVEGDLTGESWARTKSGAVTVRLPASASLKVSVQGNPIQNDFGLTAQDGKLTGNLGAGTGGSLDISSSSLSMLLKK